MTQKWLSALAPWFFAALALVMFFTVDQTYGILFGVVALVVAFFMGPRVVGRSPGLPGARVEAREVKTYRREHPEASISDAVAAVRRSKN